MPLTIRNLITFVGIFLHTFEGIRNAENSKEARRNEREEVTVHGFNGSRFRVERKTEPFIAQNSHERVEILTLRCSMRTLRDLGSVAM